MSDRALEHVRPPIPYEPERDCFLCSYPGSGRTWVRCFLGQYLNIVHDLKLSVRFNLMTLEGLVPPEWYLRLVKGSSGRLNTFLHLPRIRACHKRFRRDVFAGAKVVILTRLLEDTLASYYFHCTASGWFKGSPSEFVRVRTDELIEYYNQWVEGVEEASEYLHLSYERLRADPKSEFLRLLAFLRWPIQHPWVRAAIALSSFDFMMLDDVRDQPGGARVRRGVVRGYKEILSREDVIYIARRKKESLQLSELTRSLLAENWECSEFV